MDRQYALGSAQLIFVLLLVCTPGQGQPQKASVHIRIVDSSGQDLGDPKITLFRAQTDGQDYASHFHQGSATGLPFGLYKLRAYTLGFWSAEREVRVFQPNVWVLMSLELGMGKLEGGLSTYSLSGSIRNLPAVKEAAWVRLLGVYSTVVIDAKAGEAGDFTMAGIPQGLYVLVTTQGGKVLDIRAVQIPASGPLDVELTKRKEGGR